MLRMLGPRALVQKIESPELKSSVIEVVTLDEEPSQYALVIAVGDGILLKDGTPRGMEVTVGDTVILTKYCGAPVRVLIKEEYMDLHVVAEDDILARLEL